MRNPMGLDKRFFTWLNKKVKRLPQNQLGHVIQQMVETWKGFAMFLGRKGKRLSPLAEERMRFEKEAQEQFVKLKEKGLSIPVFTL